MRIEEERRGSNEISVEPSEAPLEHMTGPTADAAEEGPNMALRGKGKGCTSVKGGRGRGRTRLLHTILYLRLKAPSVVKVRVFVLHSESSGSTVDGRKNPP